MKLSKILIRHAIKSSAISGLSVSEQIEHWANIGSLVEANPDLPYVFIKEVLLADQEIAFVEYRFN